MSPAEELRQAAALMRERAEAAAQGDWPGRPWAVTECASPEDGSAGCACIVYQGEYKPFDEAQVPPIQYIADAESEEDAAHIASWHPAVALAVADWLDAATEQARFTEAQGAWISPDSYALKVARAYLSSSTEEK